MSDLALTTRPLVAARTWHGATALVAAVGLAWQLLQVLADPALVDDAPAGVRALRFFSYFTIQSNVLVAITAATLAIDPERDSPRWRVLRCAALVGITVTGIVYVTLIGPTHHPEGGAAVTNALLHYCTPLLIVGGWALFGPRPRITWSVVLSMLVWPVVWLAYSLVHGEIGYNSWYPYPFLDVGELGYARVALNCVGVALVVLAVASLYRWLDARLPPAPAARSWRGGTPRRT